MPDLFTKNRTLRCGERSLIMGILNVTPDSFSDGGRYSLEENAFRHALQMLADGADIIDIGGESTRPGSPEVSVSDEIRRIIPTVIRLKKERPDCVISIDTRKPDVAEEALSSGGDIINDVSGLQYSKRTAEIAAKYKAGLILMHMRGTPQNMQSAENLEYSNLITDICDFLKDAANTAIAKGVKPESVVLDPGIGFSKNLAQNLEITANIGRIKELGFPVLAGPSRKSFIGTLLAETVPEKRGWGTAGAAAWLALRKTDIIRVHDVKEIRQVLTVFEKCMEHEK